MEFMQNLLGIQRQRDDAATQLSAQKRVMEAIANTKQIESGLLDAFTDAHHVSNMHRERGTMTHRRRGINQALGGDIAHFATQFVRGNAQLAIQRLLSGKVVGGVLLLDDEKAGEDGKPAAAQDHIPGQFISVAQSTEKTYKMSFNLKFIREHFGDEAKEILRDISTKLKNNRLVGQLNTTQDFVTLEDLDENSVYVTLTKLLRELKMKEEVFAFLLVTGERKAEPAPEDEKAPAFSMDDEPVAEPEVSFEIADDEPAVKESAAKPVYINYPDLAEDVSVYHGPFLTEEAALVHAQSMGWDSFELYEEDEVPEDERNNAKAPAGKSGAPDISDKSVSDSELEAAWPNVLYKGQKVFDLVYNDKELIAAIEKRMEATVERTIGTLENKQEVYLGYSRKGDMFYMGFDLWLRGDSNGAGVVPFKLTDGQPMIARADVLDSTELFYSVGHDALKKSVSDIIDLRLD